MAIFPVPLLLAFECSKTLSDLNNLNQKIVMVPIFIIYLVCGVLYIAIDRQISHSRNSAKKGILATVQLLMVFAFLILPFVTFGGMRLIDVLKMLTGITWLVIAVIAIITIPFKIICLSDKNDN